ncbi:MAG: YcjX family protein [Hyphomicrobiaceae bacterium]
MKLSDLTDQTVEAFRNAGAFVTDIATPTVRLGVTGFARAGKTVFITALVRNLTEGGRLPFFGAMAEGRIARAYLEPQPDDDIPRFAYEDHLARLAADPPEWPESTRSISQLRVTVEYRSRSALHRFIGHGRLHIDIVDYPGEWLIDLALLDTTFADWSRTAIAHARRSQLRTAAEPFLTFLSSLDPGAPQDERTAIDGARLFTDYLRAARAMASGIALLGPGRFLMPGDLEGSPLLTFFPFPPGAAPFRRDSLGALLERRFESYRSHVVMPFFRNHFSRLDRQIVLVDALSAIDLGPEAISDLEAALTGVLRCFRPGANTWLSRILARRIDRLLIAATKADHLHHKSHDRLEAIVGRITEQAIARATFAGASVRTVALAALRATQEAQATSNGERLDCILGTPMPGERIGDTVFDGSTKAAIFPGDLPADPALVLSGQETVDPRAAAMRVLKFRPPPQPGLLSGPAQPMPHIRLDRAMDFLFGDRLA